MEVERVVVRLVADTSDYNRKVEALRSGLAAEVGRIAKTSSGLDPFAGMAASMQKSVARMSHSMDELARKTEVTRRLFNASQAAMGREFQARQAFQQQIFNIQNSGLPAPQRRADAFAARQAENARRFGVQQVQAVKAMNAQRALALQAGQSRVDLFNTLRAIDPGREVGGAAGATGVAGGGPGGGGRSGRGGGRAAEESHTSIGFGWIARQTARSLVLVYAVRQIGQLAAVPLKLAAGFDDAAVSLGVMTGSAERGMQVLTDLQQVAVETPFKFSELADTTKQLKAFGVETDQLIPTIRALADVAAGTGTDINHIALAFGQVRTAGHLMGQEFRQFTNAGVPLGASLAKVLGKRESEIPGLVRSGQVSFGNVVTAFNQMTGDGGQFAGLAQKRTKESFGGQAQAAAERLELLGTSIGKAAVEGLRLGSALESISGWLDRVRGGDVKSPFEGLYAVIVVTVEAFRRAAEWVANFGSVLVDTNTDVGKIVIGILALGAAFRAFTLLVVISTAAVRALTLAMKVLYVVVSVGAAWGSLVAGLAALKAAAAVALPLAAAATAVAAIASAVQVFEIDKLDAFVNFGEAAARIFGGAGWASTMKEAWAGIVETIKNNDAGQAFEIVTETMTHTWKLAFATMKAEWIRFWASLYMAGETPGTKMARAAVDVMTYLNIGPGNTDPTKQAQARNEWRQSMMKQLTVEDAAYREKVIKHANDRAEKIIEDARKDPSREIAITAARTGLYATQRIRALAEMQPEAVRRFTGNTEAMGFDNARGVFSQQTPTYGTFPQWKGPWPDLGPAATLPGVRNRLFDLRNTAVQSSSMLMNAVASGDTNKIERFSADAKAAVAALEEFENAVKNLGRTASRMAEELTVRPLVKKRADEINKQFEEGHFLTPLEKFGRQMGFAEEAYRGPGVNFGGVTGAMMRLGRYNAVTDAPQYGEWQLDAYKELRKSIGDTSTRYSPALFRGTGEEANVIARAQDQAVSVQQQMLRELILANEINRQSKVADEQRMMELKRLAQEGSPLLGVIK